MMHLPVSQFTHSGLVGVILLICLLLQVAVSGDQCGIRPSSFASLHQHNDRIVGGHKSLVGSWPWTATILHHAIPMRFCGAALIHPEWVLTAAHCFKFDFGDNDWYVELGKYQSDREESYSQYRNVIKIIRHPKFDDINGSYNDLVLLKLNNTVNYDLANYTINSVCLSDFALLEKNVLDQCVVIGWGNEHKEGSSSEHLREVRLPLVSVEKCYEKHHFKFDANTQICAGGLAEGGKGTCFGDSGGPLQCLVQGRWHLVGLTSYGKACALPQIADVFTKVAAYHEWIENTIALN